MISAVQDYEAIKTAVKTAADAHGEPDWFVQRRLDAVDAMQELALPEVKRYDFHRWPLMDNTDLNFRKSDTSLANDLPRSKGQIRFVQVGQTTVAVNVPTELSKQGVILTDIFSAFRDYPELTQKYFMTKVTKFNENKLTAYQQAFLNSGVFLYVPKGVEIKQPIEVYLIQDSTVKQAMVSHVLIIADEGSQFSFIQHLNTKGDVDNAAHCMVEVMSQPDSHVHFSSVDELGKNTYSFLHRRAHLSENARFDWAVGIVNEQNTLGDITSELVGEGSHSESKVIAVTTGKQSNGINNRVVNIGKHTTANISQRGVLLEKSELIFNGIGNIIHGASGANAEQENRVLMMSDQAHGDANPILLIDENDVIAGHAASVGQVDENQMYYLMSRGIDKELAQRLVIRGFLGPVLEEIPLPEVRQEMIDVIERKIEDGQHFKQSNE